MKRDSEGRSTRCGSRQLVPQGSSKDIASVERGVGWKMGESGVVQDPYEIGLGFAGEVWRVNWFLCLATPCLLSPLAGPAVSLADRSFTMRRDGLSRTSRDMWRGEEEGDAKELLLDLAQRKTGCR